MGIPQVWSNVGRLLLGKLIRNVPAKGGEEVEVEMEVEVEVGSSGLTGETQRFIVLLPLHSIPHLSLFYNHTPLLNTTSPLLLYVFSLIPSCLSCSSLIILPGTFPQLKVMY